LKHDVIDGDDDDNNDVINDVDDKHFNTFPFIHYYFIFDSTVIFLQQFKNPSATFSSYIIFENMI